MQEQPATRDDVLGSDDLETVAVTVKEWGNKKVYIRALSGAERERYERSLEKALEQSLVRATLVAMAMVDERGNRIVRDEEIELLSRKSSKVLNRLFDVARRQSGIGADEEAAAKKPSPPEAETPAPATQSGGASSGVPA